MIKIPRHRIAVEPIYDSDYYNNSTKLIKIIEKERCDQGIIKYIGEDCDPIFQVGMHVIFSGYTGTTVGVDGEILIFIHNDFVKAKIDVDNYPVPGLYHRGKIDSKQMEAELGQIEASSHLIDDIMKVLAKYLNETLIPATYESSFPLISEAYSQFIGSRVDVKKEENSEQYDPIDERNR